MKTMLSASGVGENPIQAEEFTGFNLNEIGHVAGRTWRRFIPIATTALALGVLVTLHAGAAVSIFRNGLGGVSRANPIWYLTIGIVLAVALLKIRHFVGRHLAGTSPVTRHR